MKKIIRFTSILVAILAVAFFVFFFWAKTPTLAENQYAVVENTSQKLPAVTDSTLTVMTYNIGYLSGMNNNLAVKTSRDFYRKNEQLAVQLIAETNPDIIGFQEIDFGSNRSYNVNQHQMIAQSGYPSSAIAVNWDKNYVPFPTFPVSVHFGKMLSGQSVVSKFPILENDHIVLERVADEDIFYKAFYLERIAQVVKIEHPVQDFYLINIHVEAFDAPTRRRQLAFVNQLFEEKNRELPVILIGDFNSDPAYPDAAITAFLDDPTMGHAAINPQTPTQADKTYPSDAPEERLDYIIYSKKDFDLIDAAILKNYGAISDHLPCWAKLKFKPRR
ncbi:MAG: endonuclease/exonuclease/phosphatase family protein [Capnocytophaga sp.]|nr:endonuclease/exonuclease/phosphatase family protein [Capnocytophaga sp.]